MTDNRDDIALDRLFADARAEAPAPSTDFMARLMADAEAHLPVTDAPAAARRRWWSLDGWPTFAALASTAAAGVWIGIALPETLSVPGYDGSDTGAELSALLPGYGAVLFEEEG